MTKKQNALSDGDITVSAFNVPAIEVAKKKATDVDAIVTLSTGVRVRITSVSGSLVDEIQNLIKEPSIPVWHNPDKDRDEPNPNDPEYLTAVAKCQHDRTMSSIDAMILFGVELVDGMPEDKGWLKKLKFIGIKVDEADSFSIEFAYKKYIVVGAPDLPVVLSKTGIAPGDVENAVASFWSPS